MYKRDFGVLFIAVCAVFLSLQNEGPFSFKKAWYFHFTGTEEFSNEYFANLPPPVSADLNGDGKPEILVGGPKGALTVLAPRPPGDGFARALVLAQLNLKAIIDSHEDVTIKSLSAGYTSARQKDLVHAPRKQIIVAVTTAGHVVALDHNLNPLWKQSLADHIPMGGDLDEVAVLITEHSNSKSDRGMIVIGARSQPDTLADDTEEDDVLDEEIIAEGLEKMHEFGRKDSDKLLEIEGEGGTSGRHFSYFAFSGDAGVLRWKHEALDFHRDLAGLQEATVATHHTLHAAAQLQDGVHYGEASCRDFREAILSALPHSWHRSQDTKLHLAHFYKHRAHKGAQKERVATIATGRHAKQRPHARLNNNHNLGWFGLGFGSSHKTRSASPIPTNGRQQQEERNHHHKPPNVIVAHVSEGIEAIHLYSGRTVCRLFLDSYALHADVNGDGIPDHIHAVGGDASLIVQQAAEEDVDPEGKHSHSRYCSAVVSSGIPPKQPLFNGTICRPIRFGDHAQIAGYIDVAPPTVLPVTGKHGHYRQRVLRQKSNVIFMNSRGDITAYSSSGELSWQISTGSSWKSPANTYADELDLDDMVLEAEPTLMAIPLRKHAIPSVILAAGDSEATIISEHGHELDSLWLPEKPLQPMVAIDYNLDGYTDLMLVSREGVFGWTQVRRPGAVPFSALVGVLIVIMLTVFVMQQGFMQHTGGKIKGRSTDRVD